MKKKLILICGDLAAGKSTYSQKLSKEYNILCINKDNLKEILGDNFPFKTREENLQLSYCTFDIFKYLYEKAIYANVGLILESNFRNHELAYLANLAFNNNYDVLCLVLRADIKVLHQRFLNRIAFENRHVVHKAVDFSCFEDFQKQIESDRVRDYPGEVITIDTTNFSYLENDDLKKQIKEFIER